jgi:hypothetical protein
LAASKWLFFFGFVFLLFQTSVDSKKKMINEKGMKNNEMFHEMFFFSYRNGGG